MCKRVWIAWVNPRQAVVSVPRFFLVVRNNEDSASVKQNTQIPSKLNEQKDKNKSAKIITPTNEIIRRLRKSWVKVCIIICLCALRIASKSFCCDWMSEDSKQFWADVTFRLLAVSKAQHEKSTKRKKAKSLISNFCYLKWTSLCALRSIV